MNLSISINFVFKLFTHWIHEKFPWNCVYFFDGRSSLNETWIIDLKFDNIDNNMYIFNKHHSTKWSGLNATVQCDFQRRIRCESRKQCCKLIFWHQGSDRIYLLIVFPHYSNFNCLYVWNRQVLCSLLSWRCLRSKWCNLTSKTREDFKNVG